MKTKGNTRRKLNKVLVIFSGVFLAFAVAVAAISAVLTVRARQNNSPPEIFGYSFSVVVSGSMEPQIKIGELICVKNAAISSAEEGDVVVFIGKTGAIAGERVVHQVVLKGEDEDGVFLITKGVNNPVADDDKVRAENFVGKTVWQSLFLGKTVTFFGRLENVVVLAIAAAVAAIAVNIIAKSARAEKAEN